MEDDNFDNASAAVTEPMNEGSDLSDSKSLCFNFVLPDHIASVSDTGTHPKRAVATACESKLCKWCADLNY